MAPSFDTKNLKKLTKEDAIAVISKMDSQDSSTKKLLTELLNNELIELYSSIDDPKNIKVGLTERGFKVLSNTSHL